MQERLFSTIQMRILGGLVLLMAMIALASYANLNFAKIQYINPMPATITVTGSGEVLAVPDVGEFSFSVNARAETAAQTQELSGTTINDILAYLAEQGIEETDIKTENYNMYPRWRYEERVCLDGVSYCPPGEQIQDGFEVTQTVSVKLRDTQTSGEILAGVGERGATNISVLRFTIDDTDALKEEARALAITDAQEKAAALAQQLGVKIVRLQYYYEESHNHSPAYDTRMMNMEMAVEEGGFGGPQTPVGEESTNAEVSITYEIR